MLSRATQAQSVERRWQRFLVNERVEVNALSVPLVLVALSGWKRRSGCIWLWTRQCYGSLLHDSLVSCLLWTSCAVVMAGARATVAFAEYKGMLKKARWLLRDHGDVMLLADRGFANHDLMGWLRNSRWHYCLRLPGDVLLHGPRRYPTLVGSLYPPLGQARLYRHVGLWLDGVHCCNFVLATVKGAKESWAVITNESPPCRRSGNML